MELEEYDYETEHVPGIDVVADCLSRSNPLTQPPPSRLEEHVCLVSNDFKEHLREAQTEDTVIQHARRDLNDFRHVKAGRLKQVSEQLGVEEDIFTKLGRPVIPTSIYKYAVGEFHCLGDLKSHFGVENIYDLLKKRFYMFETVRNQLAGCNLCQQCKVDPKQPKAPLVPLITSTRPMDFIFIDILITCISTKTASRTNRSII